MDVAKKLKEVETQLKDIKAQQQRILDRLDKIELEFQSPDQDFPERYDQEIDDD